MKSSREQREFILSRARRAVAAEAAVSYQKIISGKDSTLTTAIKVMEKGILKLKKFNEKQEKVDKETREEVQRLLGVEDEELTGFYSDKGSIGAKRIIEVYKYKIEVAARKAVNEGSGFTEKLDALELKLVLAGSENLEEILSDFVKSLKN
jgi:hypothetical protein